MVLVNLQKTIYDPLLTLKVYGKTDEFLALLTAELGMDSFDTTYDRLQSDPLLFPPPPPPYALFYAFKSS